MSTTSSPSGSSPSSGAERRRWRRAPAEWPITIVLDDGPHEGRVRDVSRAGVCFFLDRPVREMTRLKIELDLPVEGGRRRITGEGAVVRCEEIAVGVDHWEVAVFVQEMADPDRETIEEYVRATKSSA